MLTHVSLKKALRESGRRIDFLFVWVVKYFDYIGTSFVHQDFENYNQKMDTCVNNCYSE